MAHLTKKISFNGGFHMGEILVPIVPNDYSLKEFSEVAVKIAIAEDMGSVSFYSHREGAEMNNNRIEWNDKIMASCFLGTIDITKKGINWKAMIKSVDFQYYQPYWCNKT